MRALTFILLLLPAMAQAAPEDDLAAMEKNLPYDVRAFLARKAECKHWAGEDAYDAERGTQIAQAVARLKCERLDTEEQALRRHHAKDASIQKALTMAAAIYQ